MARPKKENPPTKERFIHVRVTEDLYDVIAKEAEEAHLSVSEYLRKLATDKRITLRKERLKYHNESAAIVEIRLFC